MPRHSQPSPGPDWPVEGTTKPCSTCPSNAKLPHPCPHPACLALLWPQPHSRSPNCIFSEEASNALSQMPSRPAPGTCLRWGPQLSPPATLGELSRPRSQGGKALEESWLSFPDYSFSSTPYHTHPSSETLLTPERFLSSLALSLVSNQASCFSSLLFHLSSSPSCHGDPRFQNP